MSVGRPVVWCFSDTLLVHVTGLSVVVSVVFMRMSPVCKIEPSVFCSHSGANNHVSHFTTAHAEL